MCTHDAVVVSSRRLPTSKSTFSAREVYAPTLVKKQRKKINNNNMRARFTVAADGVLLIVIFAEK